MSFRKVNNILLKEGQYLVLVAPYTELQLKVIAFRVVGTSPLIMVYDKIGFIDPGNKLDYNYLGYDGFGLGDDMLVIDYTVPGHVWKIYHFCIGVKPSFIRVYWQVPRGEKQMSWIYGTWIVYPGADYDFFDGYMSPFDEPTDVAEFVVFKGLSLAFAFYNDGPYRAKPILKIQGATYDVQPVKDEETVRKILKGELPRRYIFVPRGMRPVRIEFPSEWRDYVYILSREELEKLIKSY